MFHGVYVDASLVDDAALRAAAIRRIAPPHLVIADNSAAWLHGIDTRDVGADHADGRVLEVVSLGGHQPTRRAGVLGGKRDLLASEITTIHDVRVTTPLRTACDLACLRGRTQALGVLDAFMTQFALTNVDFSDMARRRFRGRRGCTQLRELAGLARAGAESQPESWTRCLILDAGLPEPELQIWVDLPGYGPARLDMGYRRQRIAIEYDGLSHHSSPEDRARDAARRQALRDLGWLVIVVTRDMLSGEPLTAWMRRLRDALVDRNRPGKRVHAVGASTWMPRAH